MRAGLLIVSAVASLALLPARATDRQVPTDPEGFKAYVVAQPGALIGDDEVVFTADSVLQLISRHNGQHVDLLFFDSRRRCALFAVCDEVGRTIAEFAAQLPRARELRDSRDSGDDSVQVLDTSSGPVSFLVARTTPKDWTPAQGPDSAGNVPLTDAEFSAYMRDRVQRYSTLPVTTLGSSYALTIGHPVGVTAVFPNCARVTIPINEAQSACRRAPAQCQDILGGFIQATARKLQLMEKAAKGTNRVCEMP